MITLIDASPVSIVFADLMSLTPPPVSRKIYDDVKLLIEEFKNSTQREFSQYEQILMKAEQQGLQQKVKQRRGRSRDRDRGLTRARGEGQRGGGQRDEGQRGGRAVTPPSIQTNAGLFAAFHM